MPPNLVPPRDPPLPPRGLVLRCRLCPASADGTPALVEPPAGQQAVYAAADHLLDEHRESFLSDPDGTADLLSVVR